MKHWYITYRYFDGFLNRTEEWFMHPSGPVTKWTTRMQDAVRFDTKEQAEQHFASRKHSLVNIEVRAI